MGRFFAVTFTTSMPHRAECAASRLGCVPACGTQHVDAFAEDSKANDPLISPSPNDEGNSKDKDATTKTLGPMSNSGKKIDEPREENEITLRTNNSRK